MLHVCLQVSERLPLAFRVRTFMRVYLSERWHIFIESQMLNSRRAGFAERATSTYCLSGRGRRFRERTRLSERSEGPSIAWGG